MVQELRKVAYTPEFIEAFMLLPEDVQEKYDYVFQIMTTQRVVNKKFVKKIETTEFYEMRVSVGTNEYRSFLFAIDALNFMECHKIVMLNSFVEKSSKQYKAEIKKARKILTDWEENVYDNCK
jgi:hypothetical protein